MILMENAGHPLNHNVCNLYDPSGWEKPTSYVPTKEKHGQGQIDRSKH